MKFPNQIIVTALFTLIAMIFNAFFKNCIAFDGNFYRQQQKFSQFPHFDLQHSIVVNKSHIDILDHQMFTYKTNLDPEKLPLAYVGQDFKPLAMQIRVNSYENETVDILHIPHGFVGPDIFGRGDKLIDFFACHVYNPEDSQKNYLPTTKGVRYAITSVSKYQNVFGHWISDVTCPLLYVPQFIWDLNPVFCITYADASLAREYMNILGHPNIEIEVVQNSLLYAEHLFIAQGVPSIKPCGIHSMPILRQKLADYYELHDIKPENYGYMNKDRSYRRFTNMKALITTLEETKKVKFRALFVNSPDRRSFAKTMASLKLFLVACGSQPMNSLFLKEGTGFLTLNSDLIDGPNLKIATDLHLWHIEVVHPKMGHWGYPGRANVTRVVMCFDILSSAIENQRWPSNNLFSPINLSNFHTKLGVPANLSLTLDDIIEGEYKDYLDQASDRKSL